jgi:aerobic carbon-monoxide dehydrogenase large subunit
MAERADGFVGRSVPRAEDRRFLWGDGRYLADLADRTTLHVAFVRSTEPHALLLGVDAAKALEVDGVAAVLTGADLAGRLRPSSALGLPDARFAAVTDFAVTSDEIPVLAVEKVCYVGQPVAAVVATSRAVAEDACEEIFVDYEPLPAIASAEQALRPDAPLIHPHLPSNEAGRIGREFGEVVAAGRAAAVTVEGRYTVGRHGAMPLECRGVLARIDPQRSRVEVWTSTQMPHTVREAICAATGWSTEEVRVAAPDVGGGFGTKANVYAEEIIVPVLARRLGRDVIWVEDRTEHLLGAAQGRDQVHQASLSVDAEGRILAWEDDFVVDMGAGSLWTSGVIANTMIHLMGPYRIPAFRVTGRAAYTNKAITAQYRGAGRPEACFALERSLDRAARRLGISGIEIRRRNLLAAADLPYDRPLPYRDGMPIRYDGADYLACLEACLRLLPPDAVAETSAAHPELDVGHGIACYIEATGKGPHEFAEVRLCEDGTFLVTAGSANAGQGHQTTLAQVAADALRVTPDRIAVVVGDTDAIAHGVGTYASRSAVNAGNAVNMAAARIVADATLLAAQRACVPAGAVTLDAAGFLVAVTGARISWADLAGTGLRGSAQFAPETVTWTMGVHAAIVGVDRETGLSQVLRYAVAHEGGVSINPMIVEGQVIGGVAQGIGGALLECFSYDEEAQPSSVTLAEYKVPTACEVPRVAVRHLHSGAWPNPLGVRGVGESGTIAAYPAIASAIEDALGHQVSVVSTPIAALDIALALAVREPVSGATR